MTEINVPQRSHEWFELRRGLVLTSSRFGDAVGVGRGKPWDFFLSLLSDDEDSQETNEYMQHGIDTEPIINEAYQLLTGNRTHPAGLWLPKEGSILHGLCGTSPDGKILSPTDAQTVLGVVEYKAPFYQLYDETKHPYGIPRHYLAQIQGQMGISGAPWCDFMAVCTKTKQISLQRVFAHKIYWQGVAKKLHQFCLILREAKQRKERKQPYLNFPGALRLKNTISISRGPLPGEACIIVKNLLEKNSRGQYRMSGAWLDYDLLMATPSLTASPKLTEYEYVWTLREIDKEIKKKEDSPG